MKLTLPKIRLYSIVFSIAIFSLGVGWWLGHRDFEIKKQGLIPQVIVNRTLPENRKDVNFSLFWEVWDRLEGAYFDKSKLEKDKMVYGAISGMVSAIGDPYTVFLPPDEQKRSKADLSGEFEGVGIQIGFKGTQLAVIAPLEGSPAQKAGIQAGDYIVGIKDPQKNIDISTSGISLIYAVDTIRGKAGTKVQLILTRSGAEKPIEVEIERKKIEVPSVVLSFVGDPSAGSGRVAHLKLLKFGEQTNSEWEKAIVQIKAEKPKAVILDMRNNPGGFLNGAVFIASEFLDHGIVVIRENGAGQKHELPVVGKSRLTNLSLVVLVNKGSASASEIVAGALKDYGRAKIVGEKTFGKGTIQESLDLDSSGLHVTTEKWLTPKGTWVHGTGLIPDVEVVDNVETEEDEQLLKALELLK